MVNFERRAGLFGYGSWYKRVIFGIFGIVILGFFRFGHLKGDVEKISPTFSGPKQKTNFLLIIPKITEKSHVFESRERYLLKILCYIYVRVINFYFFQSP